MLADENDLGSLMMVLRQKLPTVLGFEECGLLIRNFEVDSGSYMSVSPNHSSKQLTMLRKCDVFFYTVQNGLSHAAMQSQNVSVVRTAREAEGFVDGIDNLSPIVKLKEVIYVPLTNQQHETVGLIQLINKQNDNLMQSDIELAALLGPILGNYISLTAKSLTLNAKMGTLLESVAHVKSILNPMATLTNN